MEIKQITLPDSHLVIDLFNEYRIFYKQPSDKNLARDFINQRLSQNESVIFAAFEIVAGKSIPVGFTQLYPTYSSVRLTKNWILNDLYVLADFRKKGLGEELILTAIQFAKENNAKFVQLETAFDNYGAQKLYESLGFAKQLPDETFFVYKFEM
jgi:ribosomal protein S18 acetylase RimI-like enzyme